MLAITGNKDMANFIGLVFGTLKKEGVDTKNMSVDDAIAKYNEITSKGTHHKLTKEINDVKLSKQEYAQVAHTLATKYANKKVNATSLYLSNEVFIVLDVRPGNFKVVGRMKIEEISTLIDIWEEEDD